MPRAPTSHRAALNNQDWKPDPSHPPAVPVKETSGLSPSVSKEPPGQSRGSAELTPVPGRVPARRPLGHGHVPCWPQSVVSKRPGLNSWPSKKPLEQRSHTAGAKSLTGRRGGQGEPWEAPAPELGVAREDDRDHLEEHSGFSSSHERENN